MISIILILIFLTVSFLNIVFELLHNKKGRLYTKPLLMPLLILFYLAKVNVVNYLIISALLCGFVGDIFLMLSKKEFNVLMGIGAFLLGHLFYISIFLHTSSMLRDVPYLFFLSIIPYIILELYLFKKLFPSMKTMKLASFIYMSVIFLMSFTSLTRVWSISFIPFLFPFIGSLFFIFSDTVLAFDLFIHHNKHNNVIVMSTYIIAQLFIVVGFII